MTLSDGLTLVTLLVATFSMVLSCIALWPQSRQMLSFVRDIILWMVFVFVFVGAATLGWRNFRVRSQEPATADWNGEPATIETNYSAPNYATPATEQSPSWGYNAKQAQ